MAIPSPQVISTVDTVSDQRLDIDGTVWQLSTNTDESVVLYGITDNAGTNYEIGYLKERPAALNFYSSNAAPAVSGETEVTTLGAIASTKFYVDYDRAFILFPNGHSTPVNVTYRGMGSIQKAKDVNEAIRAANWAVTRYLGAFTTAAEPSVDNSGNALVDGALYYNTTGNNLMVYDLGTTTWSAAAPSSAVPVSGGTFTGAVTFSAAPVFNGGIKEQASKNLTGTITDSYFLSLAYVLTGDVTLSGTNVFGKVKGGTTDISITNDGTTRTISGSGTLTLNGPLFSEPVTAVDASILSGVLPVGVTGGSGLDAVSAGKVLRTEFIEAPTTIQLNSAATTDIVSDTITVDSTSDWILAIATINYQLYGDGDTDNVYGRVHLYDVTGTASLDTSIITINNVDNNSVNLIGSSTMIRYFHPAGTGTYTIKTQIQWEGGGRVQAYGNDNGAGSSLLLQYISA